MTTVIEHASQTISQLGALISEMDNLGQPRSDYVLRHFVVGQHDLPGRQRQQVLTELRSMLFDLGNVQDDYELSRCDLDDLCAKLTDDMNNRRLLLEKRKLQRSMHSTELYLSGRLRECEFLISLLNQMPVYTQEQLEAEEYEYWKSRLARQAYFHLRGDAGNYDAMLQMFTEPGQPKPALPVSFDDVLTATGLQIKAVSDGS